ncbi:exonuclease domain-containing protein [Nocardioides albertanoniae]|uniref:exonuclease domain-containing protein n=1 Tax=Nocardioides albertanoniae TaxID=1175486 RepID=UPI0014773C07|nr:exonuclease domain-containing protein [Nocardioides albertanoniae]
MTRTEVRRQSRARGYAVLDVETTGLDPYRDRVIQVAIRQISADGVTESVWETLVNPGAGVDPGPVEVHGLTSAHLAEAPSYQEVAATIAHHLRGRVFVAHNAAFDWAFVSVESDRAGVRLEVLDWLCTMRLAKVLALEVADKSLATIAAYYTVEQLKAHDAGDDTRVAAEILLRELADATKIGVALPLVACNTARHRVERTVRRWFSRLGPARR